VAGGTVKFLDVQRTDSGRPWPNKSRAALLQGLCEPSAMRGGLTPGPRNNPHAIPPVTRGSLHGGRVAVSHLGGEGGRGVCQVFGGQRLGPHPERDGPHPVVKYCRRLDRRRGEGVRSVAAQLDKSGARNPKAIGPLSNFSGFLGRPLSVPKKLDSAGGALDSPTGRPPPGRLRAQQ